ncbi:MAG: hypothetical protein NTW86_17395 [Candidatus Sumerlaeota bacterium]|nr:hypothetical protein [Candidatus Sumerlaeota bacterium]
MGKNAAEVPAQTLLLELQSGQPGEGRVEILGIPEGAKPLSRRLFGKFTEHLGTNVYGGAWAQMLFNPVFAPLELFGDPHGARDVHRRTVEIPASLGFDTSKGSFIQEGVAYGWLSFGEGVACETVQGPQAEIRPAQTLVLRDSGAPAGLSTPCFLPKRRIDEFDLRLRLAATEGSPTVRVAIYRRKKGAAAPGEPISQVVEVEAGPESAVHAIRLKVDRRLAPRNRHVWFAVSATGPCAFRIERAELTPVDALDGWDPEVVALYRKAKTTLVRFPGGNFVSGYRWKDGVGPRGERPVRKNPAWFGCEFNLVGTDEWLRFCELVGAEALICVNAGNGTSEEAAQWVEYCNGDAETPMGRERARNGRTAPWDVRVWEIGNELYGKWQIGNATAEEYGRRYDVFRRALLAVDPSIRVLANGHQVEWDRAVAATAQEPVETLTIHPLIGNMQGIDTTPERAFQSIAAYPVWFERTEAPAIRAIMAERTAQPPVASPAEPHLAITELQIMGVREGFPRNRSQSEVVYYAGMMNAAIRSCGFIDIVTHSALINHGAGMGKERGVVYTDPQFDAFALYAALAGARPVAIRLTTATERAEKTGPLPEVADAPMIDAVAAVRGRRLHVLVLNRSLSQDAWVTIDLGPWASEARQAKTALVSSSHFTDRNTAEKPRQVRLVKQTMVVESGMAQVDVPKHSLLALRV